MTIHSAQKGLQVLAGATTFFLSLAVGSPLDETVSVLDEWVETERMISETQAEWQTNMASMENLIEIYKGEIETLSEMIQSAEEDTSVAEVRRAQLTEQSDAVKVIENQVIELLAESEESVKSLQAVLPPPLQEELSPLFATLPEDPGKSKLPIGQRIQPIVAILTQVQKFNQTVTVVEGFREFEAGRTVQTDTIYFGLGVAYYIDKADEHAGVGTIGANGWEWRDDAGLVPKVRNFLEIYRGTQQAEYVEMPVSLK